MTRESPRYFYESIADRFEGLDHPDDLRRRLSVVFDECLGRTSLTDKRTLDAAFVGMETERVTRGWGRLRDLPRLGLAVPEYPIRSAINDTEVTSG